MLSSIKNKTIFESQKIYFYSLKEVRTHNAVFLITIIRSNVTLFRKLIKNFGGASNVILAHFFTVLISSSISVHSSCPQRPEKKRFNFKLFVSDNKAFFVAVYVPPKVLVDLLMDHVSIILKKRRLEIDLKKPKKTGLPENHPLRS